MSMIIKVMGVLCEKYPEAVSFQELVERFKDQEGIKEALNWMRIYFYALREEEDRWKITDEGREYYELEAPLDK